MGELDCRDPFEPIYESRYPEEGPVFRFWLPGIWITTPLYEPGVEEVSGRDHLGFYPREREESRGWDGWDEPDGNDSAWGYFDAVLGSEGDVDGSAALDLGSMYYNEGMRYRDRDDRDVRVGCFRAAEVLYRHAARHGNPQAYCNLGYVYSYDRCEGAYWEAVMNDRYARFARDAEPYPRDEVAYRCFALAADAGLPQACYKQGDLVSAGRGCAQSDERAHDLFARAYELAADVGDDLVKGSAALRLAHCHAEGKGCEQGFEEALAWYERAERSLDLAVRSGETFYRERLRDARAGVRRMRQELSGEY